MSKDLRTHAGGLPDVPGWLSVGVPAFVYPAIAVSAFAYEPLYLAMQRKEGGVEWLSLAVLLLGIWHGVMVAVKYHGVLPKRWLRWWFMLGTLGMVVLAGEEASWGQHLGLWGEEELPGVFRALNDQGESNVHNMTNALDQGPTNAVVVATFVAFVCLPVLQYAKAETMGLENPGYWFWPTRASLGAGLGVLVIPFPGRIVEWVSGEDAPNTLRHSEIHEFYVALLMVTYMASVHIRARGLRAGRGGSG